MSIVSLVKVTAYGHLDDKPRVLADLQDLGCLHLISLKPSGEALKRGGPSSEAREALQFLWSCPQRRKQVRNPASFDPLNVEHEALRLKVNIKMLEDERDFLLSRISTLKPWGDFEFPPDEDLRNLRLWFYLVPHYQMKTVEASPLVWEVVKHDNRFHYVVVIAVSEPTDMPVPRLRTGAKSVKALEQRLEQVESELEDAQAARSSLTRWTILYAHSLTHLEDLATCDEAAQQTYDNAPLFALQAWAPVSESSRLEEYARENGLVLEIAEPDAAEMPPTLLKNPPLLAMGQKLVLFYMTPSYRLWDPSIVVFFSFVLFFAIILSDVGYASLLGAFLLWHWKKWGQSEDKRQLRVLLSFIVAASVIWGAMVGSYFGMTPSAGSTLASLQVLDINNYTPMMTLAIFLGVLHLVIANLAYARCRWHESDRYAPVGWAMLIVGGFLTWLGSMGAGWVAALKPLGILVMLVGTGLVLWYTSVQPIWWKRLAGSGLIAIQRVSGAFGDALSYLRLFALALAGSSLGSTFNSLGQGLDDTIPGLGILLAGLVIVFGHTLNFILSMMSTVIHGLRLNYIEFFNWGMPEEGHLFKAFARKEKISWKE